MTCEHYSRRCHVRAECCNEWVACRLCHNAQFQDHEIDRHAIKDMRCDECQTVQPCAQTCSHCHANMAEYFCKTCNLFDDAGASKQIFHCDGCGICRVGGRDKFFHCATCCGCYPNSLRDKHKCLEGSMHRECAICLEVTFESLESVHVLPCGHVLHGSCQEQYLRHGHYRCPSCRTRMFWIDIGANGEDGDGDGDGDDDGSGDDDESGDDDDDDGDDDDDDGDESGDDDGGDSQSSASEGEGGDETVEDDASEGEGEAFAQASPPPPAPVAASTESGVAQRLVSAIFHALASASDGDGDGPERAGASPARAPQ